MADLPSDPDIANNAESTAKVMLTATARVPTERASRYLAQLCRHAGQMRHAPRRQTRGHRPAGAPPVARAEQSGSEGSIEFGWGRCVLRATDDSLILQADAERQDQLRSIKEGLAARLQRIARRDGLTISWQQASNPDIQAVSDSAPKADDR